MTIELILSILSFALSVGGLVPVIIGEPTRSRIVIAIIFAVLLSTTGIVLYRDYSHEYRVGSIMNEIERKLDKSAWTYNQIHEAVHYQPPQITREALFRLVKEGRVGDKQEIFIKDGSEWKVRIYYLR